MTNEKALDLMKKCAMEALKGKIRDFSRIRTEKISPLGELESVEDVLRCFRCIADMYKDRIEDGCRENAEYFICIDDCSGMHPINIFATIYVLLLSDAKIHLLYDSSYTDRYKYTKESPARLFLDAFTQYYKKAVRLDVDEEMTFRTQEVIEAYCNENEGISDLIFLGDFINFGHFTDLVNRLGRRFYLPSAHYAILDYKNPDISDFQENKLHRFSERCWNADIDYAAYETEGNQVSNGNYSFDFDMLFCTAFTVFEILREMKFLTGKVTTIIFTDKDDRELELPEGFDDCCEVILSRNYDPDKLNYDFTKLVKGE